MEKIESITINIGAKKKYIDIYHGDLSQIPPEENVDMLVVSSFEGNYSPVMGTLIGALYDQAISVHHLSKDKAVDFRPSLSCWISKEIKNTNSFKRLMCFEPPVQSDPVEIIGDIFQSIVAAGETYPIKTLAMPIVAAGNQQGSPTKVFETLVSAATHWLSIGLPLDRILITIYRKSEIAKLLPFLPKEKEFFVEHKEENKKFAYDIFISYCQKNLEKVSFLVDHLKKIQPNLRIFIDRQELKVGSAWQQEIFDALDSCAKIITAYSPEYLASKVCREEFNIALYRNRDSEENILFPIFLYSTDLPTYMKVIQFMDCREGDIALLKDACTAILNSKSSPTTTKKEALQQESLQQQILSLLKRVEQLEKEVAALQK